MAQNLSTVQAVKDWLGITDTSQDGMISANLARASAMIRNFLNYDPVSQDYTKRYDGTGSQTLGIDVFPITEITSLTIDGVSIPAQTTPSGPGYYFDDRFVFLIGYGFTHGNRNVQIELTAGYVNIPDDIETACLITTQALMSAGAIDPNIAGESIPGGYSATYRAAPGKIPDAAMALLSNYRRLW